MRPKLRFLYQLHLLYKFQFCGFFPKITEKQMTEFSKFSSKAIPMIRDFIHIMIYILYHICDKKIIYYI